MIFYPLPRQSYINHRNLLAGALAKNAIAILHSNDRYPISADQYFPFRQNKDLLRLCGIYQEETAILLYPGHPLEAYHEILFIKRNDETHKTWNGQLLDKETARNISGIQSIYWFDEFESIVYPLVPKAEYIYLNSNEKAQYPISIFGRNERLGKKIMKQFPFHSYKRLQAILRIQSLTKSKEELENIKNAIKITGDTWNSLSRIIKPGLFEYEIEAEISYAFEKLGAIHA
ncbi:MAG: aminopeptidase P N-terminal domain-containing protein, partial [Saprospiraceae bacterium]